MDYSEAFFSAAASFARADEVHQVLAHVLEVLGRGEEGHKLPAAFERKSKQQRKQEGQQARKVVALEAKLATKNEVLSELMEEHVKFKKKSLGEL